MGLCTAVGFASLGHKIICVDIDKDKVDKINRGEATIYEEGIDIELKNAIDTKQIESTTDVSYAINNSEINRPKSIDRAISP